MQDASNCYSGMGLRMTETSLYPFHRQETPWAAGEIGAEWTIEGRQ